MVERNPDRGYSRRDFLRAVSSTACVAAVNASGPVGAAPSPGGFAGKLCFFSKALPTMDWQRLAQSVKRMGFDGVDLTVRKGGHVRPETAAADLPKAVAAIRGEGAEVPMITTELVSAEDPVAQPILSAAGKNAIPYFKPGYYRYNFVDVRQELRKAGDKFRGLAHLAHQCGIETGFHNHAGYIGAPVWDIATVIDPLDPKGVGYYFDVRHAVAEGGVAGWKIAFELVSPRLKMIAVKDFYWEKTPAKGWREINCPLGEGMVPWKPYFKLLAQAGFHGPISLHLEYEIPGSSAASKEENTLAAAQRDLEFLKRGLGEAYTARAANPTTPRFALPSSVEEGTQGW